MTQEKDNSIPQAGYVSHLECLNCGEKYSLERLKRDQGTIMVNICYDVCIGPLDVKYDYARIQEKLAKEDVKSRKQTFWRIPELLPVNQALIEDRAYTPFVESKSIGDELGIRLFFKLDCAGENPTNSFKDRPVALAFNKALESGYDKVYVASTGNLAVASAYLAAETGIEPRIYVPKSLGDNKKDAIRRYLPNPGDLVEFDETYDKSNVRVMEDCQNENEAEKKQGNLIHSFIPNNSFRPYYKEGSKTSGQEIAFQIDDMLDEGTEVNIVYPLGSGALYCSAYKGIQELADLGLWTKPVRMWGAQSENSCPIIDAIGSGNILPVQTPNTLAKSIAIGNPGSGYQSLDIIKESAGGGWKVSEREILENTLELYHKEGIFAQFVGGVTLAGIKRGVSNGDFKEADVVVANITGAGKSRIEDDLLQYSKEFGFEKQAQQLLEEVK